MNPQLVLHLSVFLVAFAPLFAQLVSLLPLEIIWWRCLIATLVLVPFTWKNIKKIWESKKGLFLGISGILLGLHWWIYFLSIQYTSVAVGALVLFTYPLFTAILEPFLVKSKHSLHQVVSGFGIIAGVFFLLPEFSLENTFTQGILWGLVSALAFSFRNIITKNICHLYRPCQIFTFRLPSPFSFSRYRSFSQKISNSPRKRTCTCYFC
jgi:drug/metabolite transporter (DMT)-like permease